MAAFNNLTNAGVEVTEIGILPYEYGVIVPSMTRVANLSSTELNQLRHELDYRAQWSPRP
jgi:hypothetical protein